MKRETWNPVQIHGGSSPAPPLIVLALLGALLLYFWRFGYDYGISDQDEILPYLLHQLDPALFQQDWFVQMQASAFSVRDYTVGVLFGVSQIVPVWLGITIMYAAAWLAIAWASYRIAVEITGMEVAGAVVVVLVLVLTPRWTLGGNDLVTRMFTPSMLGWGLALPAVYTALRGRWLLCGLLLGAAAWFQALVGLQIAAALIGSLLLADALDLEWPDLKPALMLGGSFGLAALPTIVPLVVRELGPSLADPSGAPSLFYLMAEFRNPHHYLPSHFPLASYIRFGVLTAIGIAGLRYLHVRKQLHHGRLVTGLLLSIGLLVALGFVGTSVVPALFLTKLQLFKLTVLAKLIAAAGAAGAVIHWSKSSWRGLPMQHGLFRWSLLGGILLAWMITVYAVRTSPAVSNRLMRMWTHRQTPLGQVECWIRSHTSQDAVFAVPPSISSFRSNARRAVVVSFKAFPFADDEIIQWWNRLTTLAPLDIGDVGGARALPRLDSAYHSHSAADWREIAATYDIDYLLVDRQRQASLPFPVRISRSHWTLYRLPDQ